MSVEAIMDQLTPRQIVAELDQYIIGQAAAKRAVAIAMRNRWRRARVAEGMREEIHPKNLILIGPTGVGKTEIARRLARLAGAPFVKVEASKFTEVGYVGRDCESMIRELMEAAVSMVTAEEKKRVEAKAREMAEERLLDALLPESNPAPKESNPLAGILRLAGNEEAGTEPSARSDTPPNATRERFRQMLREGKLEDREVEVTVKGSMPSGLQMFIPGQGAEDASMQEMLGQLFKSRPNRRKMKIAAARELLTGEEAEKLLDREDVVMKARERAENQGIVFLDEIDKIVSSEGMRGGEVSREGVQRDLLPIVEGSTVTTKYGPVRTDHVLFVAAGAFHKVKPSDLIPELQGRFPIRVELEALSKDDLARILSEPRNALVRQYEALLETDGVHLSFTPEAVTELASIAAQANASLDNIGARRLHTLLEKMLEDIAFNAPDITAETIKITPAYVHEKLGGLIESQDLGKYIL